MPITTRMLESDEFLCSLFRNKLDLFMQANAQRRQQESASHGEQAPDVERERTRQRTRDEAASRTDTSH